MSEAMPKDLTPAEQWAWENTPPGSWQRRALVWGAPRRAENERREEERQRGAPFERSEYRATVPGENGLECVVYEYLAHRTVRRMGCKLERLPEYDNALFVFPPLARPRRGGSDQPRHRGNTGRDREREKT